MQQASCFKLFALWPERQEEVGSIAARLRAFLTLSQAPPGRSWHCLVAPDGYCDLQANPGYIERHVELQMQEAEERGSVPGAGFLDYLSAMCRDDKPRADDPYISWRAGDPYQNHFRMLTDNQGTTDPRFVTYDVMRTNVLAGATAFQPDWCQAGPVDLSRYLDREPYVRPPIGLAWMVWLSPAYAKLMKPPPRYRGTITEHLSDGSLFMAATRETFDVAKLEHLELARSIHRQIDPLNYTVPFNGKCGRSDRVPPFPNV